MMNKLSRIMLIILCILMSLSMLSCGGALSVFQDETAETVKTQDTAGKVWSIYIYMVGSDLEDRGLNQLSELVSALVKDEAGAEEDNYNNLVAQRIKDFCQEISDMGLSLPDILFNKTNEKEKTETELDVDATGYASYSIDMINSCEIPEGLQFVILTGGAKRWQSALVNPNRSQIFVIDSEGCSCVCEESVKNMADPDTLEEFMVFCKENYPAQHDVMLFWDHGGAYSGYGMDDIYGTDMLTVREMASAFEKVKRLYSPNGTLFDMIAFDACLMANLETARLFRDYADYYVASPEEISGLGWGYDGIISALSSKPDMTPAEFAAEMAKANVANVQIEGFEGVSPAVFSVLDLSKIEKVYEAYSAFARKALISSISDISVLNDLSTAAFNTLSYAYGNSGGFNLLDLGVFADNLSGAFPEEAKAIREAIADCVLFTDSTSYFSQSCGLSVYFPAKMTGLISLRKYLMYTNDVSDNPDIDALYYYKITGYLNEKLLEYVEKQGYGEVAYIDYSVASYLPYLEYTLGEDGNFSVEIPDYIDVLLTGKSFGLVFLDDETGDTVNFSEVDRITETGVTDSEGEKCTRVSTAFDLSWPTIDGNELPATVIGEDSEKILYRVPVIYYEAECYLLFWRDKATGEYTISGICLNSDNGSGTADRTVFTLEEGEEFSVVYECGNIYSAATCDGVIECVYTKELKILDKKLSDGFYLAYIRFDDMRSDDYYSPFIVYEIRDGKLVESYIDYTLTNLDIEDKK